MFTEDILFGTWLANQGDDWQMASLNISAAVALRFVAVTGLGTSINIAVDDIQVTKRSPAPLSSLSCNFQEICHWTNEGDIAWMENSGGTPSRGTGPDFDYDSAWYSQGSRFRYIFVEASSPNNPNKIAIFKSPVLDATQLYILTFAYHMKGSSMGSLEVEVGDAHGAFHFIWRKAGSQGEHWNTARLAITSAIAVRFIAVTGPGWSSDIAVDTIEFTLCLASAPELSCDFEDQGTRWRSSPFTSCQWDNYPAAWYSDKRSFQRMTLGRLQVHSSSHLPDPGVVE